MKIQKNKDETYTLIGLTLFPLVLKRETLIQIREAINSALNNNQTNEL